MHLPEEIQVSAVLKNLQGEIFCTLKSTQPDKFPAIKIALTTIAPLLIDFTPQGIQGATLLLVVGLGLATMSDWAIKFALEARLTANSTTSLQLSFNNSLLEQKLAQYQLRCLQHGVPDVLIVGSSRALRGINPQVLRRSLIDRGYSNPQIYNFGINGATAQVVDSILRQLLTPQQLPKLVIWADGA